MCFSATGSFTASAILTVVGVAALARSDRRATLTLALVPLLFAVQQGAEGTVWLTFGARQGGLLHAAGVDLFLGFALVVWPTWFPMSLFRIERDRARRRLLGLLIGVGLAVSAVGAALMIYLQPQAVAVGHGIHYEFGLRGGVGLHAAFLLVYSVPIVVSFLVATLPLARTIGALLLVGMVTALVVKLGAFASVWCFFAAIVSGLIAVALHRAGKVDASDRALCASL